MSPDELNQRFAIQDHLTFEAGVNKLTRALVDNQSARAEIYLHGGHLTSFQPNGQSPLLWMSDLARFESGKAIRGGVPIVWPWFGAHTIDPSKPQHGFARTSQWQVAESSAPSGSETILKLCLTNNAETQSLWPHSFELTLRITVSETLRLELTTRNTGKTPFEIGCALHSYFAVGDIARTTITGLDDCHYLDQLDDNKSKAQQGAVVINEEVDRIYRETEDECTICDEAARRYIHVGKSGSRSTVVWNPWSLKAQGMRDFPDDGYRSMVCIETANAADDTRTVDPGENHSLIQLISGRLGASLPGH